jgi:hypothetical protein
MEKSISAPQVAHKRGGQIEQCFPQPSEGVSMRMRSIAGAGLVAAALSVTLTGAASAATPAAGPPGDGDGVVITCRDGKPIERRVTDADREQIRKRQAEADDGKVRVQKPHDRRHHRAPEEACENRK